MTDCRSQIGSQLFSAHIYSCDKWFGENNQLKLVLVLITKRGENNRKLSWNRIRWSSIRYQPLYTANCCNLATINPSLVTWRNVLEKMKSEAINGYHTLSTVGSTQTSVELIRASNQTRFRSLIGFHTKAFISSPILLLSLIRTWFWAYLRRGFAQVFISFPFEVEGKAEI
jgi:hypothetical protein